MEKKEEVMKTEVNNNNAAKDTKTTKKSTAKTKSTAAAKTKKTIKTEKEKDKTLEQLAELQDKYLRLSAEFDNYRKRTLKEKIDITKTANEDLLINLLTVMDDFERGIQATADAIDINAVKEGMDIIYKKLKDFLLQMGVKEIDAKEKDFDTDYHEAITKIPAPSKELKGKVVDVIEKGYCLNEKVIRFSKVVIGE